MRFLAFCAVSAIALTLAPPASAAPQGLGPWCEVRLPNGRTAAHLCRALERRSSRSPVVAAGPEEWVRTYGEGDFEFGESLEPTSDGGYILGGWGRPARGTTGEDFVVAKLGRDGALDWMTGVGGPSGERLHEVREAPGGGYLAVGDSDSYGSNTFLVRLSERGALMWARSLAGPGRGRASDLEVTRDGGFVLAGEQGDRFLVARLDGDGLVLWARRIQGYAGKAYDVEETTDGGYVLAGQNNSARVNRSDALSVVKLDAAGGLEWVRNVAGTRQGNESAWAVVEAPEGGYLAVGDANGFGGLNDMFLVRLGPDGTHLWSRTVGGGGHDGARSVRTTDDGGYILAGPSWSYGSNRTLLMVKIAGDGVVQWAQAGGGYVEFTLGRDAWQTADGGFVFAGSTDDYGRGSRDMFVAKTAADGTVEGCGVLARVTPTEIARSPRVEDGAAYTTSEVITLVSQERSPSVTVIDPASAQTDLCE